MRLEVNVFTAFIPWFGNQCCAQPLNKQELRDILSESATAECEINKLFSAITGTCSSTAFNLLPTSVGCDTQDDQLGASFKNMFRSQPASSKGDKNLVLIWTCAREYEHDLGNKKKSQLIYIEKTVNTIAQRWSPSGCGDLAKDFGTVNAQCTLSDMAKSHNNLAFYRRVLNECGDISVWWATVDSLNRLADKKYTDARCWETRLLCAYLKIYDCLPLKNRRA